MKSIPDAVDVDSTLVSGKPEVQLEIDRDTAAILAFASVISLRP